MAAISPTISPAIPSVLRRSPRLALRALVLAPVVALLAVATPASADSVDRKELAADLPHATRSPVWLRSESATRPPALVYQATEGEGPRPLVMFLHGMCDAPENECPELAGAASRDRTIVCPRADLACTGGGTIWNGRPEVRTSLVNGFLERAETAFPGRVDPSARTLVGFSLGSFVALDVAQRQKGTWKNLILIGAKIEPDARKLKEAGIESVLLGAGDRDMMKWHMVKVAESLNKKGIRATFQPMGDVGHWFAPDMDAWLTRGFAWLERRDERLATAR